MVRSSEDGQFVPQRVSSQEQLSQFIYFRCDELASRYVLHRHVGRNCSCKKQSRNSIHALSMRRTRFRCPAECVVEEIDTNWQLFPNGILSINSFTFHDAEGGNRHHFPSFSVIDWMPNMAVAATERVCGDLLCLKLMSPWFSGMAPAAPWKVLRFETFTVFSDVYSGHVQYNPPSGIQNW